MTAVVLTAVTVALLWAGWLAARDLHLWMQDPDPSGRIADREDRHARRGGQWWEVRR